jgi:transcriptional regulator with XRE-family HTH domain
MSDVAYIGPGGRRPSRPLLRTLLGDVLRRKRLGQRRTLADVARHARVSVPYLSEVERGRKEASSEVLAAVCDALRIDLSDLVAEVGRELADRRARVARFDVARQRDGVASPAHRHGSASLAHHPGSASSAHRPGDAVLLAA